MGQTEVLALEQLQDTFVETIEDLRKKENLFLRLSEFYWNIALSTGSRESIIGTTVDYQET